MISKNQFELRLIKLTKFKICMLFLLIFSNSFIYSEKFVTKHGQLKVQGTFIMDKNNEKIVFRGVSLGWSNEHYKFYNESIVKWLKDDWNVTAIRTTIGVEPENGYLDSPLKTTEQIFNVIDAAIKNDIYVIVAWHCSNMHYSQSKDFFIQVAKKYGKHPNIIYEIFTEPDNESWSDLKSYYQNLITDIRNFDKQNIILISASYWTQQLNEVTVDPLVGFSNIMYTVHFCVGESGKDFREKCDYAISKGIPVIVTDHLLTNCSCNGNLFIAEWNDWTLWFEKNYISWLVWSISDKNESCSMLLPNANSNGHWNKNELNQSGIVIREKLKSYKK